MNKQEILEFAAKNPVCSLATIDGPRPRARTIMLFRADETGIIFCTGRDKDMNKQLQANPAVELCFYNHEQAVQVRIEGTVEMVDDLELKKQIVEAFSFLKDWVEKEGYEVMIVYRVRNARATTWTMATSCEPKKFIQL
ncbi:MAG: pyridoxamine 5'-phosphate oxidase family protein [Phycisphaerales bacterium]|nr:MAG: pyridoxamine 5'-phosphate oxidase family protein [Phycisphaerales bacterium]